MVFAEDIKEEIEGIARAKGVGGVEILQGQNKVHFF